MIAVIFTAEVAQFDADYSATAAALRDLALSEFGCVEFNATTEGNREITVSIWPSQEHIAAWRAHPLHREAQQRGRDHWYQNYRVQVAEIQREYSHNR